jgi:hypothetical protein
MYYHVTSEGRIMSLYIGMPFAILIEPVSYRGYLQSLLTHKYLGL